MRRRLKTKLLILLILLFSVGFTHAATLPTNVTFVGLSNSEWQVYQTVQKKMTPINELQNSRNITFSSSLNQFVFIANDSSIQTYQLQTKKITPAIEDQENRYTQPKFSHDGKRLFAVMLKQGQSRSTEIIEFIDGEDTPRKVVVKRTAQFDPYMFDDRYLYYTTAICVDGCGKMIWELWRKDMFTGIQEQLTLLNAVSRQPILKEKETIYFSSNKAGYYHIWRMEAKVGGKVEQLTEGDVHDSDPAFDKEGNLHFIRRTAGDVNIMMRHTDGRLEKVDLPAEIEDVRNLEIRY